MSPGGALSMIVWVRLYDISTVWCWFATQACASPEKSMNVPMTANTLSSSVSLVQAASAGALPSGQ